MPELLTMTLAMSSLWTALSFGGDDYGDHEAAQALSDELVAEEGFQGFVFESARDDGTLD